MEGNKPKGFGEAAGIQVPLGVSGRKDLVKHVKEATERLRPTDTEATQ